MKICVFCSSSNAVDDIFFENAEKLGNLIGTHNHTLVYGGANVGLMEHVANHSKKSGAKVIGVIPQKIHDNNLSSSIPDNLIITPSMSARKTKMHQESDAFIALPGGFGTLEEILEVITLKQLDYHRKPIVFLNINGFYDQLIAQFNHSFETQFAKETYKDLYKIFKTPLEIINYIENYHPKVLDSKWFKVPRK